MTALDDPRPDAERDGGTAHDGGADALDRWDALVAQLAGLRALVEEEGGADDPRVAAEGVRYLLRFLAAGIDVCVEHDDVLVPAFTHSIEDRRSWGLDNPDCLYTYTRVAGDGVYRVHGTRGTAAHLELQVNTGHQGDGNFAGWGAVAAISGDDLPDAGDGTFEVVLGGGPDEVAALLGGRTPAVHLPLGEEASFLLVRQYFGDWAAETPAGLAIDRLEGPLPAPALSADVLGERLALLGGWLDTGLGCWAALSRGIRGGPGGARPTGDVTPFLPPASASGLKGQAYGFGGFRCAPDEAVLLELDPPACRLWSVSLCDRWWQSIDFADRQSSLNGHQAVLDPDGRFRAVLCHDDPGLANWLDPGGETEGTIALRYLFAPDQEPPDPLPTLRARTVPRADLAAHLAPDAPRVTAAERRAALVRRRLGVARRYRR